MAFDLKKKKKLCLSYNVFRVKNNVNCCLVTRAELKNVRTSIVRSMSTSTLRMNYIKIDRLHFGIYWLVGIVAHSDHCILRLHSLPHISVFVQKYVS